MTTREKLIITLVSLVVSIIVLVALTGGGQKPSTSFDCFEDEYKAIDINGDSACIHHEVVDETVNEPEVAPPTVDDLEADIFEDINEIRAERGLEAVVYNSILEQSADLKALDHIEFDYWAHNNPNGTTWYSFPRNLGWGKDVSENLAWDFDSVDDVVPQWELSPSHAENMFNPNHETIGISVMPFRGDYIYVTHYGGK